MNKNTVTGMQGLKVRCMGTTEEQPLTTQARFILQEVVRTCEGSTNAVFAQNAIDDEREVEHVENLAFQITDHPKFPDFVLFDIALDSWILEVVTKLKQR